MQKESGILGSLDIGIDLGTTKIIIYKGKEGEILREPAIVAVNTRTDEIIAVGERALSMLGKTPGYMRVEFPMADGVISDHNMISYLLKDCIKRACDSFLVKHRVIVCVPSIITDIEKRAIIEAVINAGGRKVFLIEEPIAAAIGAGIDVSKPNGIMVVDVGGGTADVAVISLGSVVVSNSIKFAGNKIDSELIKYLAATYKLSIGQKMAQKIKCEIGNVYDPSSSVKTVVKGRNMLTSYPQEIELSEKDVVTAILPFAETLAASVKSVLERTPPELSGDIIHNGILLTGGGSLLKGLCSYIADETGLEVTLAENPIECVSRGTGHAFEYIGVLQDGFSGDGMRK